MAKKAERYVVVATKARPWTVACGKLIESGPGRVVLKDARMAVYWSSDTKALFGLAISGPKPGSRISGAVELVELDGCEVILDATTTAVDAWRKEPW